MPFLIFFNKFHVFLIDWAFGKQPKGCHDSTKLKIISESLNLFLVSQIKTPRKKCFYRQLWIPRFHEIKILSQPSFRSYCSVIRKMIIPLPRFYLDINISNIHLDMCHSPLVLLYPFPPQPCTSSLIKILTRETITNNRIAFLFLFQ